MRILVDDDDPFNRRLLQAFLVRWSYEVILARDGGEVWDILQRADAPKAGHSGLDEARHG
jgi:CheY-like chemotaxis protein